MTIHVLREAVVDKDIDDHCGEWVAGVGMSDEQRWRPGLGRRDAPS